MESFSRPIACKLTTPELKKRKETVIAELKSLVRSREELRDGFSYEFSSANEILDKLNSFIKTERLCCDFFTFELMIRDDQALLSITGPTGAKAFLQEEVDL